MQEQKPHILFISHDASLTGAPVLLLNLLNALLPTQKYRFSILLFRGGPLEQAFAGLGPLTILKPAGYFKEANLFRKIFQYLGYRRRLYAFKKSLRDVDIVFNNTIANGPLIADLPIGHIPLLTYVHELESVIRDFNATGGADKTLARSSLCLVPSEAVAENLVQRHGVSRRKILPLDYFIPGNPQPVATDRQRNDFFTKFQIPPGKCYVCGMGVTSPRKGFDIFLEACEETMKADADIHFVWIGDPAIYPLSPELRRRIDACTANGCLTMTGKIDHALNTLSSFDIFALTSREDPYPLVVLEAAACKVPSICFEGSGGAPEFIKNDAGWILPGFSARALSRQILDLKDNRREIESRGETAYRRWQEKHGDAGRITAQFHRILDRALNNKNA